MSKPAGSPGSPVFDEFWKASEYNRLNLKEVSAAQERYSSKQKLDSIIEYPLIEARLPLPKTSLNRLAKKRLSTRSFSTSPLSKRELGTILSCFYGFNGLEHRSYPSAGASYAVEVYCVANNVAGYSGRIYYYNPDRHALSPITKAPDWSKQAPNINVEVEGTPQCIIIFGLFINRLTDKYLERGGRFGLIETGAAMQQLALQVSGSKRLQGVAVGGLVDDYWLDLLKLQSSEAKIALGYLCGK